MTFAPEKVKDFLSIYNGVKDKIKSREGCKHLDLLNTIHQPNVYFTLSHWQSEKDIEEYRHSELFKSTWSKTKQLFAAPPEAWSTKKALL